jgi:hypothetical protein
LPKRTVENFVVEIATDAAAIVALVREENREETEVEVRIGMRTHTTVLGRSHRAGAPRLDEPRGARPLRAPLESRADATEW